MNLPDRPEQRRRRCWFHASTVTKYVTIRSEVGWFLGHWKGGCVRCSKPEVCTICDSGAAQRLFTYLMVECESGEVMVFEIPERLYDLSLELEDSVGTQLAISRDGTARNSRIEILITGYLPSEKLDIQPFIATLGRPHERSKNRSTQSENSVRSGASESSP